MFGLCAWENTAKTPPQEKMLTVCSTLLRATCSNIALIIGVDDQDALGRLLLKNSMQIFQNIFPQKLQMKASVLLGCMHLMRGVILACELYLGNNFFGIKSTHPPKAQ